MKQDTTTKDKLTLERLKKFSCGNISEDIKFAEEFYPQYPSSIPKPKFPLIHTSADAKKYANELSEWEKKDAEYKKSLKNYNEDRGEIESIIEAHIKEESGFNKLPDGAKEKVWSKAWSDGHSEGYVNVYYHLKELVELFDY